MTKANVFVMLLSVGSALYLGGCAAKSDPRDPGIEYAPQMYHSIPLNPILRWITIHTYPKASTW